MCSLQYHSLLPLKNRVCGCQHLNCLPALQTVKAPGNLVISAYVTCPDITLTVTPDLKLPGDGRLLHVDLARERRCLGGSALAQAYNQVNFPERLDDADNAV